MTIEDLIGRSTIEFPAPLGVREVEKLIRHLSMKLPAHIHYNVFYHRQFFYDCEQKKDSQRLESILVNAFIRRLSGDFAFDAVEFQPSGKNHTKIGAMRFVLKPGYTELAEYWTDVVKIWDDTRELVGQYFAQKKQKRKPGP